MSDYWKKYWNTALTDADRQSQVGRTIKKQPVSSELFDKTVDYVKKKIRINKKSRILEICCGNGVWTVPFSKLAEHVTAIDISKPLLSVLKKELIKQKITNVELKLEDVATIRSEKYKKHYTCIFWYAAIQHFSEQEVILLFETAYNILKSTKGVFYIGEIPDRQKLWDFANTKEYEKMYFDSVKNGTPAIGTWFIRDDLIKLARYAGFSKCEIINQPSWQYSSRFRFDMKLGV